MPDDAPALSTPLLDAVRAPIQGGAPAGIDMAYEDDFLTLKSQVDAMGAATGGVDFAAIVDGASRILTGRSKDVSVACYLAFGLSRTGGFAGLAEGVAAVRAVAETFWDEAFPPLRRMRARQSAMQFMAERLNGWAEGVRATEADRDAIEHAVAETAALQAFTTEAMGDDAPALSGLARTLREALRQLPARAAPEPPPAAPEPAAAAPAASPQDVASAPAPSAAPAAAASGAPGSVSDAQADVFRAAGFLREQDPLDATARLLVRAVRWGEVAAPPPDEGGRTFVPAPPPGNRDALAALLAAGNLAALAQAGEDLFPEPPFHFWLDLQRLLATALEAQGPPARAAHAAVVDATAAFVRRLPTLPALAFDDGTPFADPMTVAWLDEICASGGGGAPRETSAAQTAIGEARAQAGGGDVPGAVADLVGGAGAPRDRFERGVAAAELCLAAGRPDVALALLDDADDAIRLHRLDVWDPAAASAALRLLHAASTAVLGGAVGGGTVPEERQAALRARADDAFARLARIDPGVAMRTALSPLD